MSDEPLVSVTMPVYNDEDFLEEAILSILKQSYENLELVIVDDHSTDSSWEIIQKFEEKDFRVRAFRNEENMGIPKTRNRAFSESRGKYYAILDSDDVSSLNRIEKQLEFMEKNEEYGAIGSQIIIVDEDSEKIGHRKYPTSHEEIVNVLPRYNPIAQSTIMIRSQILEEDIGYYNEEYERCQDYDLWFRIALNYKIKNIDEFLVKYRVVKEKKASNIKPTLRYDLKIQKKYQKHTKFRNNIDVFFWTIERLLMILPDSFLYKIFTLSQYED